jgi:hypothetical protein
MKCRPRLHTGQRPPAVGVVIPDTCRLVRGTSELKNGAPNRSLATPSCYPLAVGHVFHGPLCHPALSDVPFQIVNRVPDSTAQLVIGHLATRPSPAPQCLYRKTKDRRCLVFVHEKRLHWIFSHGTAPRPQQSRRTRYAARTVFSSLHRRRPTGPLGPLGMAVVPLPVIHPIANLLARSGLAFR